MSVFPELVVGRHDGADGTAWKIQPGSANRGGASCNFTERILTVPLGERPVDRVVRAHELMHVRVSPSLPRDAQLPSDVHPRAAECAEEFRVNFLLTATGFDMALLCDGTEKVGATRLAESGAWDEAICFLLVVAGTGAERPYFAGLRMHRREWVAPFRALLKRATAIMTSMPVSVVASTHRGADGALEGYSRTTIALARAITQAMHAKVPETPQELQRFRRSLETGGRRAPTGMFAPLVVLATGEVGSAPRLRRHRRHRPSVTGTSLRYPSRLLGDPLQRAFGAKQRSRGGVILIDQSGSMDLDVADLESLLQRAPDALILGYSHRPGDVGATANAWVLADANGVRTEIPPSNIGNGVDGPALEWAIGHRRPGEPVVWVTDGQVTDSHDHPCDILSLTCASLVLRHGVRLVRTLEEVLGALAGRTASIRDFGRVGRAACNLHR